MPSPKYPLKSLLDHRERAARDRTAELGGAVRAREAAESAKDGAERVRSAAEAADADVRSTEAALLAQGALSVADLARSKAWEVGAQARSADLTRAVDVADRRAASARSGEASARTDLANALAERDVVVKDEARFTAQVQKKTLAAEEEQAEEAFRGGCG